jgi:nucleoside-diphosphate-sugar epimerase
LQQEVLKIDRGTSSVKGINKLIVSTGIATSSSNYELCELELRQFKEILNRFEFANIEEVYFVSSGGSTYENNLGYPMYEDSKLSPKTPYGKLKLFEENLLKDTLKRFDSKLIVLRLANVFSNFRKGITGAIIQSIETSNSFNYTVAPDSIKQYGSNIDYGRVITNLVKSAKTLNKYETRNIFSPNIYRVNEIVNHFLKYSSNLQISPENKLLEKDDLILATNYSYDFASNVPWISLEKYFENYLKGLTK